MTGPTDDVVIERAISFATETMWTVELQVRRLGSAEPEDDRFVNRWWVDLQFLIGTLRRLRRTAELAATATNREALRPAIEAFDRALPSLKKMRDVNEHFDSYVLDSADRHEKSVDRKQLQVGSWDGRTYSWLSDGAEGFLTLDVQAASLAAYDLYEAIRSLAPMTS
ncbi:MAG: hypothetical protein ACRDLE_02995 [Gaiellaceae bacterium]